MRSISILTLFFIELFTLSVCAQSDLSDWFVKSQSQNLEILSKNSRLDLLDYYDSGLTASVENSFKGTTRLIYKDEHSIKLQLTPLSTYELFTLYADTIDTIRIEFIQVEAPVATFKVWLYLNSLPAKSLSFDVDYFNREIEKLNISPIKKHQLIQDGLLASFDLHLKQITIKNRTNSQYKIPPLIYSWDTTQRMFIKDCNKQ